MNVSKGEDGGVCIQNGAGPVKSNSVGGAVQLSQSLMEQLVISTETQQQAHSKPQH